MRVMGKPAGFPLLFEDCVVSNQQKGVSFVGGGWDIPVPDGIMFSNLVIKCQGTQDWVAVKPGDRGLNPALPTNITGNVTVEYADGRCERVLLDAEWCKARFGLADPRMPPPRIMFWPKDVDRLWC